MNFIKTNRGELMDFEINIKIRLSFFWAAVTLCYLYGDYFELYVPHKVEGLVSGENLLDSPLKLFAAALLLAIPAVMVFLSVVLKPLLNKMLNIIFGLLLTTVTVMVAFTTGGSWRLFYLFLAIVESLITATIVWTAWRWPNQKSPIQ